MAITELRNGQKNGYKIEYIQNLPEDKIIIALVPGSCKAFLVIKDPTYKNTGHLVLRPITKLGETNDIEYSSVNTLLLDDGVKVLALSSLADFKDIEDAYYYN